jgi:glycine betaine/choline ABC-type transport system substrate-binding protein
VIRVSMAKEIKMKKAVSFEERSRIFKDTVAKYVIKKKESITTVWEDLKRKQKEEIKEIMTKFNYFDTWSEEVREEVAEQSSLKSYKSKEVVKGTEMIRRVS